MSGAGLPAPTAEGTLASRPFAHVLLYVHQQQLSGTLAVWPEGGAGKGQDRILFRNGTIVGGRLLSPASALDRGLLPLFTRTDSPYAFYEIDLVGSGEGVLAGEIDPVALITASLRGAAREDAVDAVLGRLGDARLRLTPRVALDRYGLDDKERAFVELVRADPDTAEGLCAAWGNQRMARRLLYLLAITGSVEPWSGERRRSSASRNAHRLSQSGAQRRASVDRPAPEPEPHPAPEPAAAPAAEPPQDPGDDFSEIPPEHAASMPPVSAKPAASQPEGPPEPPPGLAAGHADLWNEIARRSRTLETMNYYQMLGVARDAGSQQVRDAYFALAKKWHPDRLPAELAPLRPWVDRIFHYATQARDTLSDETTRGEYLKSVQAGGGTPEADRKLNAIVTAAMAVQKVEVLVRRREWVEALRILREALELNPEDSDAHAMEGWVLLQMSAGKSAPYDRIHQALDRALALNERNAKAHFYKAVALKGQNKAHMALDHFRKCAQLDPKNIEAAREVRLAEMRGLSKPPGKRASKPPPSDGGGLLGKLFGAKKK